MPSVKNPSSLISGGGFTTGVVPTAKLQEPSRDVASLTAHLTDPSRAHMASAIGIVDAGGFYSADQVEGALQEIAAGHSAGRQNGVVAKCTLADSGLVITIGTNSSILIQGVLRDVSGLTVTCPAIAGTYYVYFTTAGVLTIGSVLPSLAGESVMIAQVTCDGAAITDVRDARFFVANLDRKLDYTARSDGSSANNSSEACFVTLEAAFFWLEQYSDQDIKKTLIIRGGHTITSSLVIPTSNVTIIGEGSAFICTSLGVTAAINLNGQDGVTIQNLLFQSDGATLARAAISDATGLSGLIIRDCEFVATGSTWNNGAINLSGTSYTDVLIERCSGGVHGDAVAVNQPIGTLIIRDCVFTGTAVKSGTYAYGIVAGAASEYLNLSIENCKATEFEYGVNLTGSLIGVGSVRNCKFIDVVGGVACFDALVVESCEIRLDNLTGLYGVICGTGTVVRDCTIVTTRDPASYSTYYSAGVFAYDRCVIEGCYFEGFYSTTAYRCDGVLIAPVGTTQSNNRVSGNHFQNSGAYFAAYADIPQYGLIVHSNTFDFDASDYVTYGAISVSGIRDFIVSSNIVRCKSSYGVGGFHYGVDISGGVITINDYLMDSGAVSNCIIKDNIITAPRFNGVSLFGRVRQWSISGNTIDGYSSHNPFNTSAYGIRIMPNTSSGGGPTNPTPADVAHSGSITSNRITRCYSGVYLDGTNTLKPRDIVISSNDISYCAHFPEGTYDALDFGYSGSKGIGTEWSENIQIIDNSISNIGIMRSNDDATRPPSDIGVASNGVYVWNTYPATIEGNTISGLNATSSGESHGIHAVLISGVGVLGEQNIRINNNVLDLLQDDLDSGVATSGGASTLTANTKVWPVNHYMNCVVRITSGAGSGQTAYIASNTATVLTVVDPWGVAVDNTSGYSILQSEVNGKAGIRHTVRQIGGLAAFVGLQIDGNRIHTHTSTSVQTPFDYGVWIDGNNGLSGAGYSETRICDNMIHGWSGSAQTAAIALIGNDSTGPFTVSGLAVNNNTLLSTEPGVSYNSAIRISSRGSMVRDCSISNNAISGEDDSLIVDDGIVLGLNASQIRTTNINSNVIVSQHGVRVIEINGTGSSWRGLSISDNQHLGSYTVTAITNGDVYDCRVENNTGTGLTDLDGVRYGVVFTCDEFYNVSVSGNRFQLRCANNTLGIVFTSESNKGTPLSNLGIDSNSIRLYNIPAVTVTGTIGVDVNISETVNGISISHNNIDFNNPFVPPISPSTISVYALCGVRLHTSTTVTPTWRCVRISDNNIRGVFLAAVVGSHPQYGALVLDTQTAASTGYVTLNNAIISANRATGHLYASSSIFLSSGFYMRLRVVASPDVSGVAVTITDNAFTEFKNGTAGTCAQFVGTVPTHSICTGNISEDGGALGFSTPGTFGAFAAFANNLDY